MRQCLRKHDLCLSLLLVLAVMAMIFCFSAETGEESGRVSGKIVQMILDLLYPRYRGMSPERQLALWSTLSLAVRKTAHFAEFSMLGASLMLSASIWKRQKAVRFSNIWLLIIGVLYAASDELHQYFVGGRAASIADVGIDSLGVLFGLLLMRYLRGRMKKPT